MVTINVGRVTGLSAYEIAVKNGFEGTEQDWIDSVGATTGSGIEFVDTFPEADGDKIVFLRNAAATNMGDSKFSKDVNYRLILNNIDTLPEYTADINVDFNYDIDSEAEYRVVFGEPSVSATVRNIVIQNSEYEDGLPDGYLNWIWAEETFIHEMFGEMVAKTWYGFDGSALTPLTDVNTKILDNVFITSDSNITRANENIEALSAIFDIGVCSKKGLYYTDKGAWKLLSETAQ